MTDDCGCEGCETDADAHSHDHDAHSHDHDAHGDDAVNDAAETRLSVPDMDCPSCAGKVERALTTVSGVHDVDPRPATGRVVVGYDPEATTESALVAAIESAGYDVEATERSDRTPVWHTARAYKTYVGAALLSVALVLDWGPFVDPLLVVGLGYDVTVSFALYLIAAAVAGQEILRNGFYSMRARSLDIDLLMSIGVVAALIVGLPFEAATLAVLFSIAELLEGYAMDRARSSLRDLTALSPDTATVVRDGEEVDVPASAVEVGEVVVVRPGDRVPVDGVVVDGESAVDESAVTGESLPVDKTSGDDVYAGSVVDAGYLEVEAAAPAAESTIARVVELVEDAQANRTQRERFVDRFAATYTPIIVVAAAATAFVPPLALGAPFEEWFRRGLTLLVVACPCAFVISTPVSVVSAVTSAARAGVLVKGGDRLEALTDAEVVALDKTGTLTRGDLRVTDVVALDGDEDSLLARAAALERRSEHPIGRAVVDAAEERGVDDRFSVSEFEALTGEGVRAVVDDRTYFAGKPGLFADRGHDLSHAHVAADGGELVANECDHDAGRYVDVLESVDRLQSEGKTVILVGTDETLIGAVAVADTIRPESSTTVERLREMGFRTVLLTGDNERTARAVGAEVGVDEVRADLLPEEKADAVAELELEYGPTVMVGDGVNDAPALARATVGVAMGAAGTDAAIETADVALLSDDVSRLPYLFDLSSATVRVIRQNVWSALAVKAALAVAAPLGLISVAVAVVVGDMGMSLAVTGNALRLAGVDADDPS
jgi:Cd2+/Zn2+-exporting ATPase